MILMILWKLKYNPNVRNQLKYNLNVRNHSYDFEQNSYLHEEEPDNKGGPLAVAHLLF